MSSIRVVNPRDIGDEHRHLTLDPIAAADTTQIVDIEDPQQFVGHESRLHVHQRLPMLIGVAQPSLELEVPQRRGRLGAQEGDRLLDSQAKLLPGS